MAYTRSLSCSEREHETQGLADSTKQYSHRSSTSTSNRQAAEDSVDLSTQIDALGKKLDNMLNDRTRKDMDERIEEIFLDKARKYLAISETFAKEAAIISGRSTESPSTKSISPTREPAIFSPRKTEAQRNMSVDGTQEPVKLEQKAVHGQESLQWRPAVIRNLKPFVIEACLDLETFSKQSITSILEGKEWSPSFYFISRRRLDAPQNLLKGKTYWLVDHDCEPFMPTTPGVHGAKLTPFFPRPQADEQVEEPTEEDYYEVPVFVGVGKEEYMYMGHYSQCRYSDKLDHDTMRHVPSRVLRYWAERLCEPERPEWLTVQLMEHFWPKPVYTGPLPADETPSSTVTSTHDVQPVYANDHLVRTALARYAQDLKEWELDARMRVSRLNSEAVLQAFEASDTDTVPGLRLYWEYLRCVSWDEDFYKRMLELKHNTIPQVADHFDEQHDSQQMMPQPGSTIHASNISRVSSDWKAVNAMIRADTKAMHKAQRRERKAEEVLALKFVYEQVLA